MALRTLLTLLVSGTVISASEESPFEDFVVGVWPEYDHPGVLVIYTGSIKNDRLPLHFEARIPDATERVLAIGQSKTSDDLEPVPVKDRVDGKWISITLVKDRFQIEFYFDPFDSTVQRKADLTIQLNHSLADYHVAAQHPLAAEDFHFSEQTAESFTDEHGITYYRIHAQSLPKGQSKTISFSYLNRSGKLSLALLKEMLGSEPSAEVQQSPTRYRLPTYQPLFILLVLSVVIGLLFWKSNYRTPQVQSKRGGKNFCPNCGSKVGEGDRFCSSCGEPVK